MVLIIPGGLYGSRMTKYMVILQKKIKNCPKIIILGVKGGIILEVTDHMLYRKD